MDFESPAYRLAEQKRKKEREEAFTILTLQDKIKQLEDQVKSLQDLIKATPDKLPYF